MKQIVTTAMAAGILFGGAFTGYAADAANSPLSAELNYTFESVHNFAGGLKRGTENLGSGTAGITVDLDKAKLWPGATVYVEFLLDHGRDPSATLIGDIQTASNIADGNRTRLQQFWIEQSLMDEKLSLLFGTHDLNSEFEVTEYGGLFTNSSFGVTPEISGNVTMSIFPAAGLALRAAYQLDEHVSMRVAAYDGDPTTRALHAREGYMYIGEAGYASDEAAYKVGIWRHTKGFNNGAGKGLNGIYALVDQPLMAVGAGQLGIFMQLGTAQAGAEKIKNYVGLGLHLSSPLADRQDDEAGIAFARAAFSSKYRADKPGFKSDEKVIELTYRAQVTDWLALQPAFQYIIAPSGNPANHNASVGLLRFEFGM